MFDPLKRCTVDGILADSSDEHFYIPKPLLDRVSTAVAEYLSSLRTEYDDNILQDQRDAAAAEEKAKYTLAPSAAGNDTAANAPALKGDVAAVLNFQKKMEALKLNSVAAWMDDHSTSSAGATAGAGTGSGDGDDRLLRVMVEHQTTNRARADIIVIASFVSRVPNVAGLFRTCEIFNASKLVIGDKKLMDAPEFEAISVTAEKWLPYEVVPELHVASYLKVLKQRGYTVIALEQSANSVPLQSYQFPERVVLLLGAEKEGVPIQLLNDVDASIEIPQFGIIRSLNVHVSASMMLWEYTRQRLVAKAAAANK